MKNGLIALAALAAGLTIGSAASATTIDFSDLSAGTVVTNQYAGLGVNFAGAEVGTCVTGCPAPNINGNFIFSNTADNSFTATFSALQSAVTFQVVSNSSVLATAFDSMGHQIDAVADDEGFPISGNVDTLSGIGIASIVFSYNGGINGPAITNLTFAGGSAVPEAATWAMMIAGVGMVGGAMRRRSVVTLRNVVNA